MDLALGVGDVVVEGQCIDGLEVGVDAFPEPAFDRLAEGTAGCPSEPPAEDPVADFVLAEAYVHPAGTVGAAGANGVEIRWLVVGKRRIGFKLVKLVVEGGEHGVRRVLVGDCGFDPCLVVRDVAAFLAALDEFSPR